MVEVELKDMEFRPKPLFGVHSYIKEQAVIYSAFHNMAGGLSLLAPIEYLKKIGSYPAPERMILRSKEKRLEIAKRKFAIAKEKLESIGIS